MENILMDINEKKTREEYINPLLKQVGWKPKYIKEEVNSIKSNFNTNKFVFQDGNPEKGIDRFIDYLLLDENENPLAIIEAKRFSKNPDDGRTQARTYALDIEKQTKHKIPIFLTNGKHWRFIDEHDSERKISNPFSQTDLSRRRDLYTSHKDPSITRINPKIVNRDRSVQIVKKLSKHFAECHRTALIEMATGTGKTRVAMAIIDLLINANIIRNVLFIADRITLVRQAEENFKEFLNESVANLRDGFNTNSRLYVSTVQTLMGGEPKLFENIPSGFFDLIVFDEAHRSYYDKNNLVFQYFDAIKIGLTATPRENESQSTADLFDKAVTQYSYIDAVNDNVLVPFVSEIISTEVLDEGIEGKKLNKSEKDQLRRQNVTTPEDFEASGSEFDKVFMNNKTNELILSKFMEFCYKSDENKPAKTIFFCSSKFHANRLKRCFDKMYPKYSDEAQVITYKTYRAQDEIKRFKNESNPRIIFSVNMLDTGVDIPEVCNLVIIKQIFSHIQFWQMIGRGTRNFESCKHPEWLFDRKKDNFLIMDFVIGGHSNIEFHSLESNQKPKENISTLTKIFNNQVDLLKKNLDPKKKELITGKISNFINDLHDNFSSGPLNFIIREKSKFINDVKGGIDLSNYVTELNEDISPLIVNLSGDNPNVILFILNAEKLFGFVLDRNREMIFKIKKDLTFKIKNVHETNLEEVKEKRNELIKSLSDKFWEDLTFEDVEFLVREIAPLMKYYHPKPKELIEIHSQDKIIDIKTLEMEIPEDEEFKRLLETNNIVKKLKEGKGIISIELLSLEKELSNLKPEITIHNIQRNDKDFLEFLREIIGLTRNEDPKQIIEKRFHEFIIDNGRYNEKQINFLIVLKKVFANRKYIEMKDLIDTPFEDYDLLSVFTEEDLINIIEKCNQIKMC